MGLGLDRPLDQTSGAAVAAAIISAEALWAVALP